MKSKDAYIFLNGELQGSVSYYKNFIGDGDIYCADGGANLAFEVGVTPLQIWGDMDSIDPSILKKFKDKKVLINKFNEDKDFTDGELILDYVSSKPYGNIYVIGALGGRTDHALTNMNLLFKYSNVKFITEREEILQIKDNTTLFYPKNTEVSFVPFSDVITGLSLEGFKYNLDNFTLNRGASICMSNIIKTTGNIKIKTGKLICIIQTSQEIRGS